MHGNALAVVTEVNTVALLHSFAAASSRLQRCDLVTSVVLDDSSLWFEFVFLRASARGTAVASV